MGFSRFSLCKKGPQIKNKSKAGGLNDSSDLTPHGVTEMIANNVLGHVVLLENLLATGKIAKENARVILSGSELVRGIW